MYHLTKTMDESWYHVVICLSLHANSHCNHNMTPEKVHDYWSQWKFAWTDQSSRAYVNWLLQSEQISVGRCLFYSLQNITTLQSSCSWLPCIWDPLTKLGWWGLLNAASNLQLHWRRFFLEHSYLPWWPSPMAAQNHFNKFSYSESIWINFHFLQPIGPTISLLVQSLWPLFWGICNHMAMN